MLGAVVVALVVACFVLVGVVIAFRVLISGLRGDLADALPRCGACLYVIYGDVRPAHCPECGSDLRGPDRVRLGRRVVNPARVMAGVVGLGIPVVLVYGALVMLRPTVATAVAAAAPPAPQRAPVMVVMGPPPVPAPPPPKRRARLVETRAEADREEPAPQRPALATHVPGPTLDDLLGPIIEGPILAGPGDAAGLPDPWSAPLAWARGAAPYGTSAAPAAIEGPTLVDHRLGVAPVAGSIDTRVPTTPLVNRAR